MPLFAAAGGAARLMYFFSVALAALSCIPWNKVSDKAPAEKIVHICPGEIARMVRFSYWENNLPYRALLVVRADHTVAVQTSTHKNQFTLNDAQKEDLRDALESFPDFYKLLIKEPYKPKKLPSQEGGIDFYVELRRGKRLFRWSNTRFLFANGYGGVPLFSALEVYQYLLQPSRQESASP